jgi:predicted nucleic acid-binding protein
LNDGQDDPRGIVVDASVAIKWHLRDEVLSSEATVLLAEFASKQRPIAAPAFIRYELANVLEQARRQGRISHGDAQVELETFLSFGLHAPEDSDTLIAAAARVAATIGASAYDATYVAFAEALGFDLVSTDSDLLRQIADYPVNGYHLAEFAERL